MPVECFPLGVSEGTRGGNKKGISDYEVLVIKLGDVYRIKLGGDEGSGTFLSYLFFEGDMHGNHEDGSKYLEYSALGESLG